MSLIFTILPRLCIALCLSLGFISLPEAKAAQTERLEQKGNTMQLLRLANGLSLLLMEDKRFPLVSTRLYIKAGSTYEKPAQAGISHVLEHMVFKGTKKRPKGAISEEVERAGGYLNAATSFDYTVYITDMPHEHWKLGMDIVADMAFHAEIDPKELEAEKNVVLAELQRGKDSPYSRLFEDLMASSLENTPYARPIIGYEDTIKAMTAKDIKDYIKEYYQPQNMLLVVVGNIELDDVIAEAQRLFGAFKNTHFLDEIQIIPQDTIENSPSIIIEKGQWNKVYFAAAFPAPNMNSYESSVLDLAAYMLGGDNTSYFTRKYRHEKQLVHSISVVNMGLQRAGVFFITAELDADKVTEFWETLTKDLANLSDFPFNEEEFARAKVNLEDGFYRSQETLAGFASKIGQFQLFMGGQQGERNTIDILRFTDEKTVREAIKTWIRPERLSAVLLPPMDYEGADLDALLQKHWPAPQKELASAKQQKNEKEIIDLGNNHKLILLPDTSLPYISLSLLYSGGDALSSEKEQGLASLTARMLAKGTKDKNSQELEAYFSDRAISLMATAGQQSFSVQASGPSRFQHDLLEGLGDLLNNSVFDKEEFVRVQKLQIASIKSREDNALGRVFRQLPPFLFPHSVYGYQRLGTEKGIMGYTADMTKDFWKKQAEMPWVLAVSGDFDRESLISFAKSLPKATKEKLEMPKPVWGEKKELNINMPGREQAHLMLIFETVPEKNPDTPGLNVLQSVLAGMSGVLFKDLRDDKGLGYTVTAFNQHTPEYGYMAFYIGTEPEKLDEAMQGFEGAIDKLQNTLLPNEELERGKNQLEGDYYRAIQSFGARSSEAASLSLRGEALNFLQEQLEKSKKVSPKDLQNLAKKYFDVKKAYIVELMPLK